MPDQPTWYQRVPQIIEALERSHTPVLDRFAIEKLFGVSRRQAIRIMGRFGGYQAGRTCLLERTALLRELKNLDDEIVIARARPRRIWHVLEQERLALPGRAIEIPPPPHAPSPSLSDLPPGIELRPGCLTIAFAEPIELLQRLVALSQALASDYQRFERAMRPTDLPTK